MSGNTSVPTVIAACSGTVLAAAAIVGLTAAAQEYVLGQERDVAIQLSDLRNGQATLNQKFDALLLRLQPAPAPAPVSGGVVLTQEQIDAAMRALVAQIAEQIIRQQEASKPPDDE